MFWNLPRGREFFLFLCCITLLTLLVWQTGVVPRLFYGENTSWEIVDQNGQSMPDIQSMDQTDKNLLQYVRANYIFLPSVLEYSFGKNKKLKMLEPTVDKAVFGLFKNKTKGFFVEVGANDGFRSHTLILERDYGWGGLLIECNPELIPKLKGVNRKAYVSDVCLSSTSHPVKTKMTSMDKWLDSSSLGSGNLFPSWIKSNFTTYIVQTVPLYSIIASIDVKEVDLIVLDVQSLELDVLHNFRFDLILVKVWLVEVYFFSKTQRRDLLIFMEENGYPQEKVIKLQMDYVFIHRSHE